MNLDDDGINSLKKQRKKSLVTTQLKNHYSRRDGISSSRESESRVSGKDSYRELNGVTAGVL